MPTKPEAFAHRLARLRQAAGMTQVSLALATGISIRTIQDLEQGVNLDPRWSNAVKLADALGVSTEDMR
jgi:transcriptional regulator with XRE-family HTH domain